MDEADAQRAAPGGISGGRSCLARQRRLKKSDPFRGSKSRDKRHSETQNGIRVAILLGIRKTIACGGALVIVWYCGDPHRILRLRNSADRAALLTRFCGRRDGCQPSAKYGAPYETP
jgi:hypothetical protein